jgi:hypothetical protein
VDRVVKGTESNRALSASERMCAGGRLLPTSLRWCVSITSKLRTTTQGNLRWPSHKLHYSDLICIRLSLFTKRCSKMKQNLLAATTQLRNSTWHKPATNQSCHYCVAVQHVIIDTRCLNASKYETNLALPSYASCFNTSALWNTEFLCCRIMKDKLVADWPWFWCLAT